MQAVAGSWRTRPRCGPSPARCAAGRTAASPGGAAAPRRARRRCRGRRCRRRRRRTVASGRRGATCCAARNRTSACPTVSRVAATSDPPVYHCHRCGLRSPAAFAAHELLDLRHGRHEVGAAVAGDDDRAGGVAQPRRARRAASPAAVRQINPLANASPAPSTLSTSIGNGGTSRRSARREDRRAARRRASRSAPRPLAAAAAPIAACSSPSSAAADDFLFRADGQRTRARSS